MTTYGLDFRNTSGYATDPANNTYCLGDQYPTTRGGLTFGYINDESGSTRDRDNTNDARLAGMIFFSDVNFETFRVDLPAAGTYNIGCAMGDPLFAQGVQYIEIFDDVASFGAMQSSTGPSANNFYDINGNVWAQASFFANQTFKNATFSSTILKVKLGKSGVGTNHCLAHLDINQAAGGSTIHRRLLTLGAGA